MYKTLPSVPQKLSSQRGFYRSIPKKTLRKNSRAFESILAQVSLFSDLPDNEISQLSGKLLHRRYEREQIIFHKNDPGTTLHIIISGKVKILLPSSNEENVLVDLLSPGDFFGELSLFDGEPRSATAIAVETTDILTLDQEDLFNS